MYPPVLVNGLPLPPFLVECMATGRWKHPGNDALYHLVPFFQDDLIFLDKVESMELESRLALDAFPNFRVKRSQAGSVDIPLPWLDTRLAVTIAVNQHMGEDIALVLDYRPSLSVPRVVANNWHTGEDGCLWEIVSPSFEEFVQQLGL